MQDKITILILTANPKNTNRLRIDEEVREIRDTLKGSLYRERFKVEVREAVRPEDIQNALLEIAPQIVQFSGHGEQDGLILEDDAGQGMLAKPEALRDLFKLFKGHIECVFLNACYSQPQAEAIAVHVSYVIGMSRSIGDQAALKFATGLYCGLGAGKTIPEAFEFGRNRIQFYHLPETATPILLGADAPLTPPEVILSSDPPTPVPAEPLSSQPVSQPSQPQKRRWNIVMVILIATALGFGGWKLIPPKPLQPPQPTPTSSIVLKETPTPEPTAAPTKKPEPTPVPTATPTPSPRQVSCWENETPGAICTEKTTGMEFVYVPGGEFWMGCGENEQGYVSNEKPRHKVTIKGFWMGKYEVTQAQWEAVTKDNPSIFKGANRPVELVSWNDTQTFLKNFRNRGDFGNLTPRLPSEAEWEYACRAGTDTAYSFENLAQLGEYAWYADNSGGETHPVGQKQPNDFGLYDMHGNVWEWVADTWHDNYNGAPNNGDIWGNLGD